jgi:4-diphosphocytidyl-2-C-methyl-D-erythritol kinase
MGSKEQFESVDDGLLVRAPAKINLSLLVAGQRADGFHEIETVMAKVNLYDEILIQPGQKAGIELVCTGPYWAPEGKENLVYKACELFLNSCGVWADIRITLTKNIPARAGLGSASSDAAATLLGLNRFLSVHCEAPYEKGAQRLVVKDRQLRKLAPSLGSDVAFFLDGPLAYCTGKGEKVKKLRKKFDFLALLILPDVSISTKEVYASYRTNRPLYERLRAEINSHIQKNRFDLVSKMCANMLQTSCFNLVKGLAGLKAEIESLGIRPVCLSGSGSVMFYITEDRDKESVEEYRRKLEEKIGCKSVIVSNNRW